MTVPGDLTAGVFTCSFCPLDKIKSRSVVPSGISHISDIRYFPDIEEGGVELTDR